MANPLAPPGGYVYRTDQGIYRRMGGVSFPNLAGLLAAYQTDNDVNILSTPHILTTDNEEAEIIVGQEVPFAGAREVLPNSGTSSSIYSINYKNVGLTLRLTPHINQDDYVKLEIYQEIKQMVSATVSQEGPIPTTTVRQAKTTVVVKNGQTVVLGGLIQDDKFLNSQRVPCLGSIPLLGVAFRSMSKHGQKRNLQIFITPHIVKDPEDIDIFTAGMQNKLKEQGHEPPKNQWQQPKTKQQQPKTGQQQPKDEKPQPKTGSPSQKTRSRSRKQGSSSQKTRSRSQKQNSSSRKQGSSSQLLNSNQKQGSSNRKPKMEQPSNLWV